MYVYVHIPIYIYVYVYIYKPVHPYMHRGGLAQSKVVGMYIYMDTYRCIHVCIYICMYTYRCIYIYIYICMYEEEGSMVLFVTHKVASCACVYKCVCIYMCT